MKNAIPDPDELKHRTRARYRELCFRHGNPVLIKVLGQTLADQAVFALHTLSANLPTLRADEPELFNDVGLALMAAGQPTMNATQQPQLFDKETFRCAREVGRWLCQNRLQVTLDQPQEYFPNLSFEDAVDLELKRVSVGLPQPKTADESSLSTLLEIAADQQVDGRSTSTVCFGVALALLQNRRFRTAISVALLGYQASFDNHETWVACGRFMELVGKASAEGLLVNDLPDWCTVMLLGEGADLGSVPQESISSTVQWVRDGDIQLREALLQPSGACSGHQQSQPRAETPPNSPGWR